MRLFSADFQTQWVCVFSTLTFHTFNQLHIKSSFAWQIATTMKSWTIEQELSKKCLFFANLLFSKKMIYDQEARTCPDIILVYWPHLPPKKLPLGSAKREKNRRCFRLNNRIIHALPLKVFLFSFFSTSSSLILWLLKGHFQQFCSLRTKMGKAKVTAGSTNAFQGYADTPTLIWLYGVKNQCHTVGTLLNTT